MHAATDSANLAGAAVPRHKKAYIVRESSEGHATVVFEPDGATARRVGAASMNLSFEDADSCKRAPEFDEYAGAGAVPPLVLLAHGWWFMCDHCSKRIDNSTIGADGEELIPVADDDSLYCNSAHMMASWRDLRDYEDRMNAVVEACSLKFYGLPIFNLRGHEHYQAGGWETISCCDFDFPGRTGHMARWDLGSTTVQVSQCDALAWEAVCKTSGNHSHQHHQHTGLDKERPHA